MCYLFPAIHFIFVAISHPGKYLQFRRILLWIEFLNRWQELSYGFPVQICYHNGETILCILCRSLDGKERDGLGERAERQEASNVNA